MRRNGIETRLAAAGFLILFQWACTPKPLVSEEETPTPTLIVDIQDKREPLISHTSTTGLYSTKLPSSFAFTNSFPTELSVIEQYQSSEGLFQVSIGPRFEISFDEYEVYLKEQADRFRHPQPQFERRTVDGTETLVTEHQMVGSSTVLQEAQFSSGEFGFRISLKSSSDPSLLSRMKTVFQDALNNFKLRAENTGK